MLTSLPPAARREAHRLLARLLELPPERRPAALVAECDDADLRNAVLRLLREAERPDGPFEPDSARSRSLWTRVARDSAERERAIAQGARLGPYRIVEEIERGGMAVVYRAEQADGELEREVAVKILKLGLDTEEVVRRFHQERQILADLDHPDIARLYAAGRTEDGRPYFVMELVEGLPIDRYCAEHRLSVEERLELFCVVAEAVDYAHKNLIVHRDLKPANILVSPRVAHGGATQPAGHGGSTGQANPAAPSGDGVGAPRPTPQVKLLDFGIARLLDIEADGGSAAPPTRSPLRPMTPEYASPEQVRGERVTTATDVYQLGLLLYELLTGRRPYTLRNASAAELERVICEEPPPRPSTVVDRARLRRRLRGDLDDIVLQALHKEPRRRYSSADRLVQDIRRHLDGLPVTARPNTWLYRGGKFFQRHALGAGTAVVVLGLALGMAGFHTARVQAERDRAELERDRAQAEAIKAQQVSQVLSDLFRSADPHEARGNELSARELLERGVAYVERELAEQPDVQAEMFHVLGVTYLALGHHDAAGRTLSRALGLRRRSLGAEHPAVARTLAELGRLRIQQGEYKRARGLLGEALGIFETTRGTEAPGVADVLEALSHAHRSLGDYDACEEVLERALAIQSRTQQRDFEAMARILASLGTLHFETGALELAEAHYRRALTIYERRLGGDHPSVGTNLINLAVVRTLQGKLDGVESIYRRSLELLQRTHGPNHTLVGLGLNNFGDYLNQTGRSGEALDTLQRAVEILSAAVGHDHPQTAVAHSSLGDAYLAAGHLLEARRAYEQSLAVRQKVLRARRFDPLLVLNLTQLGVVESKLGHDAAAKRLLNRAAVLWRKAPEATDPQLGPSLLRLGGWLADQGRCAEATPLLRRARDLEIDRNDRRPQHAELNHLLARCSEAPSNITVADVSG